MTRHAATGLAPGAARVLAIDAQGMVAIEVIGGAWVELGSGWVHIARERSWLGPLTARIAPDLPHLTPGAPVTVAGGVLRVEGVVVDLAAPVVTGESPGPLGAGWQAALAAVAAAVPRPGALLWPGIAALAAGDLDAAAGRLTGLGPGLTPEGDDVLAGAAAWFHAAGDPRAAAALVARAQHTTPLSAALLNCAARGELVDVGMALVRGIRSGDRRLAARQAQALSGWGASSGRAIVAGLAAAGGVDPGPGGA